VFGRWGSPMISTQRDLAPQVGFEPTTLRLTAEAEREPVRSVAVVRFLINNIRLSPERPSTWLTRKEVTEKVTLAFRLHLGDACFDPCILLEYLHVWIDGAVQPVPASFSLIGDLRR
jgi:hypothetical protein